MISALLFAAATASTPPHQFSGGNVQPIHGTSAPLLQKAAPKPNVNATAGPLLRKAAPQASTNAQGRQVLNAYSGAGAAAQPIPGTQGRSPNWGWAGLFGVIGLIGLWRRYS